MASPGQHRIWIFSLPAANAALAIAFLLIAGTTQPAQAQTYQIIFNFTNGANPEAGLTMDAAGNLYGTTAGNGVGGNVGTVFKLTHRGSGWTLSLLYSFNADGSDGATPIARVLFGPDGALYGTTEVGGGYGYGTVFSLRPPATVCRAISCPWTETVLYSFAGSPDGAYPGYGDLAFDRAGNIYGTTINGGDSNEGVVYELTPSGRGWTESVLYRFGQGGGTDGFEPFAGVIFDGAGNLYGTTYGGGSTLGGTVYQLTPSGSGWTENIIANFVHGGTGPDSPIGGLIFDGSGNLYGATPYGGINRRGVVYELTPSGGGWTESDLYAFVSPSGSAGPYCSLTLDAAGNLYGTTYEDGINNGDCGNGGNGCGTVFKLTQTGGIWTETDLYDFTGINGDGTQPISNVVFDSSGNLYGTTTFGGSHYGGIVWEITP